MGSELIPNRLRLEDAGVARHLKYTGGAFRITDNTDTEVMNIETHQARHIAGGADALSGLTKTQLAANTIRWSIQIPIIAETARTGLAADSTGVKWESIDLIFTSAEIECLKGVYIEATWTASATDSVTAIEVYDATAATVRASVSGNTGTNVRSSAGTIVAGNINRVRINVTTASATTGATTNVTKAVLILLFGAS